MISVKGESAALREVAAAVGVRRDGGRSLGQKHCYSKVCGVQEQKGVKIMLYSGRYFAVVG
jgi:hypothetical protein